MFHSAPAFSLLLLLGLAVNGSAEEAIDLSACQAGGQTVTVSLQLDAGGHSIVRLDSDEKSKASERKLPISVAAKLEYEEHTLADASRSTDSLLAVRYYHKAEAVLKVDEAGLSPRLADEHRLIALADASGQACLYAADRAMPREQIDLINVVGNSYYVDRLLPHKPMANGDTWSHDAAVMAPLLALDSIAVCEVTSILDEYNEGFAKIRLAGIVHGMADGAATEMEIRALYLFDRKLRRVTKLNLAIHEKRAIGAATPGLDAVAKVQMTIAPAKSNSKLTEAEIAKIAAIRQTPNREVLYEAAALGFRLRHDRQWYVTGEQRESILLRRVDQGDLVAQCTITSLPSKSVGRQATLEQFQKDVTYSLGKNFGEMVSSRQWQNEAGHYCYGLVARGVVEEVPVEWHYYLIAPESGHRVSVAVTVEKPMVERLGTSDRELVESLELFPRMPVAQTAAMSPQGNSIAK